MHTSLNSSARWFQTGKQTALCTSFIITPKSYFPSYLLIIASGDLTLSLGGSLLSILETE